MRDSRRCRCWTRRREKWKSTFSGTRARNIASFYCGLPGPVRVGIEASCATQWFLQLMEELGVECWVGHPAKIRAYEPRKQKNDRRDARLLMHLLEQDIFPSFWGAIGRATRCAGAAHASTSMGAHSRADSECIAIDRIGSRVATRIGVVEQGRTTFTVGIVAARAHRGTSPQRADGVISSAGCQHRDSGSNGSRDCGGATVIALVLTHLARVIRTQRWPRRSIWEIRRGSPMAKPWAAMWG